MTDDIVEKLLRDAVENAFKEKCCLTCEFSYLNYVTGTGYCRKTSKRTRYTIPKNITETSFCNHWKKKDS